MDKQYKIIVNNGKTAAQEINIPTGQGQQPVRIAAKSGDRYVLQDLAKQPVTAPDTVRASRKGKNLHLSFDDSEWDGLIIEDYYDTFPADYNAVTAIGVTGVTADSAKLLSDVVDNLATDAVDTVAELQALSSATAPATTAFTKTTAPHHR